MKSYVERAMHENENIVHRASLHWIIYQNGLLYMLVGAFLGHIGASVFTEILGADIASYVEPVFSYISLGIVGFGAIVALTAYIRQLSTELVITDQRVIAKHGFISTTSYELMMTKVEGATIDQTVWGRLWGYGTLMVKGTGGGISPIDHVAQPYKFHNALMKTIHEVEEDYKEDRS